MSIKSEDDYFPNPSAFPSHGLMGEVMEDGMSLRDYFAAKAMQSLVINPKTLSADVPLSVRAYEIADAMLKERDKSR